MVVGMPELRTRQDGRVTTWNQCTVDQQDYQQAGQAANVICTVCR